MLFIQWYPLNIFVIVFEWFSVSQFPFTPLSIFFPGCSLNFSTLYISFHSIQKLLFPRFKIEIERISFRCIHYLILVLLILYSFLLASTLTIMVILYYHSVYLLLTFHYKPVAFNSILYVVCCWIWIQNMDQGDVVDGCRPEILHKRVLV